MKLIDCPGLGPRPQSEFVFGGEVRTPPAPDGTGDREWLNYVFNRHGAPAVCREWWYHSPTGMWFVLERDTLSDTFVGSVPIAEVQYET